MAIHPQVYILEKEASVGDWLLNHLSQISVPARWLGTVADLLSESEAHPPVVCLIALHPPIAQVLALVTELIQEPRFAQTAFILMGPIQYKHAAFEAGADDYLITPQDVIELRKRVRLYLDRASLEARLIAETRITEEIATLGEADSEQGNSARMDSESITLLEHSAAVTVERNLFEMILINAGNAIALVEPDGTLTYVNPAWERLFAPLPPQTKPAFGWPPVTTDTSTNREIAAVITDHTSWQGEARFPLGNHKALDLSMSITPAFDANNDLAGFVLVQTDVGERKALDDLKTRFISDAATEMRTPVTNIKMRQYLLREAPPEQHDMHITALGRETERLHNMVEAMLELSRLDAGLIRMTFEPTSVYRLVNEAIIRYGPTAAEKGVTLAMAESDALPNINLDSAHIARALGEAIENAIEHTPEAGHITIRITAETWSGGQFQTIQVRDTGIGIDEDALPLIFDRFYRSDRSRDSGIRGVGLGLAIAQEIIARHQGAIMVESKVNEGSTFTFWLPVT